MSLISSSVDLTYQQPIGIDLSCLLNDQDLLLQTPIQHEIDNNITNNNNNNKLNSNSSNYLSNEIENNFNLPELNQDLIIEIFNNNEFNTILDQEPDELDFILNDIQNPNSNTYNYLDSPSNEVTCDLNMLLNPATNSFNLDTSLSIMSPSATMTHSPIYMDDETSSYQSSSNESSIVSKSTRKSSSTNVKRLTDKRESNKQAALRYRNKKLKERDELFNECQKYAIKNETMKKKIDDIQTEISFIKSLLVEALIAKNNK